MGKIADPHPAVTDFSRFSDGTTGRDTKKRKRKRATRRTLSTCGTVFAVVTTTPRAKEQHELREHAPATARERRADAHPVREEWDCGRSQHADAPRVEEGTNMGKKRKEGERRKQKNSHIASTTSTTGVPLPKSHTPRVHRERQQIVLRARECAQPDARRLVLYGRVRCVSMRRSAPSGKGAQRGKVRACHSFCSGTTSASLQVCERVYLPDARTQ